ncbi:MAG: hypothetical protein GX896_00890 [Clostridiales bacterium]|nr:hypothetical protein [Clostridiales bacterium]
MDFIIIGGSPGNGKTTIATHLHKRLHSPWFEFGWIPEFNNLNPHTKISMSKEELISFENLVMVCKNYKRHGFKNIILTDLVDKRMMDIPIVFNNNTFVIISLYSENNSVIKHRILNRDNGNQYKDYEASIATNEIVKNRALLPNEYRIRTDNQTPDEITDKVISVISTHVHNNCYDISKYSSDDYVTYINE